MCRKDQTHLSKLSPLISDAQCQKMAIQALQPAIPPNLSNLFCAELIQRIIDSETKRFHFRDRLPSFDEPLPGFESMPQFLARALFVQTLPLIEIDKKREHLTLAVRIGMGAMLGGIGGAIGGAVGQELVIGAFRGGWAGALLGVIKGLFMGVQIGVVLGVILGAAIGIIAGLTARLARGISGVIMAVLGAAVGALNGAFWGTMLKVFGFFPKMALDLTIALAAGLGVMIGTVINVLILSLAAIIKNPNPSVGRGKISSQNWQESVEHYASYFPVYLQLLKDCLGLETGMEKDLNHYHLNNLSLISNPLDTTQVNVLENFMMSAVLLHKINQSMHKGRSAKETMKYAIANYKVGVESLNRMKQALAQTDSLSFPPKSAIADVRLKKKKLGFDAQDTIRYVYEVYEQIQ